MSPDVVVVGAGVFGAWIAWHQQATGRRTLVVDQYGVATSRASSGGETRLTRAGYGRDAIYTRAARTSLDAWRRLERATGARLFEPTGVLTIAKTGDMQTEATLTTLLSEGVPAERLTRVEILARAEVFALPEDVWGVLEPEAGVLHARRGVEAAIADARRLGAELMHDAVLPPERGPSRLDALATTSGRRIPAATFVFAAGPWLPATLPDVMVSRLFVTRQEVFFFGAPRGDRRYAAESLPAWIDFQGGVYGHGDLGRGVKIAIDRHGPPIDPDTADRSVATTAVETVRRELAARLPGLADAPLLETRVCQYENSANGDFLIDRHPAYENVWIAGGGSGHGFKHGPFVGEYVRQLIEGRAAPESRFALATKGTQQSRAVY
jgi:glycine/D-amino acid oxidase-like deaminating enzyme